MNVSKLAAWRRTLIAWDLAIGAAAGGLAGGLCISPDVRAAGQTLLIAEAALGAAFLSVTVAALSISAAVFGGPYAQILDRAHADDGGLSAAFRPYVASAGVGAAATVVGLVGAVAWPTAGGWVQGGVLGLSTLLVAWAATGMVGLSRITVDHIRRRATVDAAAAKLKEVRGRPAGQSPKRRTHA